MASRRRARGAREHPVQVTASLVNCERVAVKLTIGSSQKTPLTALRCVLLIFSPVDFQKTQEKLPYLHHPNPLLNTSRAYFSMNFTSKSLIYKGVENLQDASYKGTSMVIFWKFIHTV